jgi:hypothetical protein
MFKKTVLEENFKDVPDIGSGTWYLLYIQRDAKFDLTDTGYRY